MPSRVVTTAELVKVLRQLGFKEEIKLGSHTLFRDGTTKASVTLPTGRKYVPVVHLQAIQETLFNYGIVSRGDFEKRLDIGSLRR